MECTYCNEEMTLGYIQCRDGVYWPPKKQLVSALAEFSKGSTSLSNGAANHSQQCCG